MALTKVRGDGIGSVSGVNLSSGNVTVIDGQGFYFGDGSYRIEGKDDGANARIGFVTNSSEIARFTSNGLTFNGDTAVANALDDYEEGTWTPTIARSGTAPSVSYSSRTGGYIKVGKLIFVTFDVGASSVSGGSGDAQVTGLPYNVTDNSYFAGYSVIQWRDSSVIPASGASTQLKGFAQRGAAYLYLQYDNSGSSGYGTNSNVTSWNSSGRITGYVTYVTD